MYDYPGPETAYYSEAPSNPCAKSLSQKGLNEQGWIVYGESQDIFLQESETLMCKSPKPEESSSQPSEPKEKVEPHKLQAIIPDYLLKKIQEHHEKEASSPSVIEQDRRNREESEKLRQQRIDQSSPSEES